MDIPQRKVCCEKCRCQLVFPDQKKGLCGPCARGESEGNMVCFLCTLKGGEMTSTLDGKWVHLVCGLIACDNAVSYSLGLRSKHLRDTEPPAYIQVSLPASTLSVDCSKCWGQAEAQHTIRCLHCHRKVHFSCFLTHCEWNYTNGFECGCRKIHGNPEDDSGYKKAKMDEKADYEPIRAPTASTVLRSLFETVIKLDEHRLFRKETAKQPFHLPVFLSTMAANLPDSYLTSPSSDEIIGVKKEEVSVKTAKEGLLSDLDKADAVVERDEPVYISDFEGYEDSRITSLDYLYTHRVSEHYYFAISQVITDLGKLMSHKISLAADPTAVKYIHWFWGKAKMIIKSGGKDFDREVVRDWKNLRSQSEGIASVKQTDKKTGPPTSRTYTCLRDFEPVNEDASLLSRLQTSQPHGCSGAGCNDFSSLGPFDLAHSTWISANSCRSRRMECTDKCQCDPQLCCNRQLSLGQEKRLGIDVKETPTWGFDVLTFRTIMAYLRQPVSDDMHIFIAKSLPKAINRSEKPDIRVALGVILTEREPIFTLRDKRYARGLLNALEGLSDRMGSTWVLPCFALHPKGTGVICTNTRGIKANELIVPYIGELYSPSQWLERQDVTKALVKKDKQYSGQLPDFYNIWLERHPDDPQGYDLLMIDPIVKGTYGSRLSHSCAPNCGTVAMVAQGRYTIGMYALEDIEYGQELTFDYHSVTESAEEHFRAVCLCAASQCRGYYLSLGKPQHTLSDDHGFLYRIACILRSGTEALTNEDECLLTKSNIRSDLISTKWPWVRKWTALILKAIEQETRGIRDECERKTAYSWYMQNLVQCLDRVNYCLGEHCTRTGLQSASPPIELATSNEIRSLLWSPSNESLRTQLKELYIDRLHDKSDSMRRLLDFKSRNIEEIRMHLLKLRDYLREQGVNEWCYQGVADMLHLYAFTRFWIRQTQYSSFQSAPIDIRYCDITSKPPTGKSLQSVYGRGTMKYPPTFVEGTLAAWFKHVEGPNVRLTQSKRGTVILPCFSKMEVQGVEKYTPSLRRFLLNYILRNPQKTWPNKCPGSEAATPWVHFDGLCIQGSPMLDSAILGDDWSTLKRCLRDIDVPAELLRDRIKSLSSARS